jgi:hypothetical protein
MRDWNGQTHLVDITAEGIRWRGATYRSLFAVARAITGARWSGPRFFGLGAMPNRPRDDHNASRDPLRHLHSETFEEELEQEFSSLEAQREACSARSKARPARDGG